MKEGMLWYDNQNLIDVAEKITSAIDFFQSKYGFLPAKCYLNPQNLEEEQDLENEVKVLTSERVIVNHIWLEFPSK